MKGNEIEQIFFNIPPSTPPPISGYDPPSGNDPTPTNRIEVIKNTELSPPGAAALSSNIDGAQPRAHSPTASTTIEGSPLRHPSAVITVVRDPKHTLGKRFELNTDGTISKKSSVCVSLGIAVMHQINTHEELAVLLNKVGEDPSAAIINAVFSGIDIGDEFIILSEREIEKRLDIPRSDREEQKGVHQIEYDGKRYKAIGRFKENVRPSCWQFFDRDIDSHTPAKFAAMSFEEWISAVWAMLPEVVDMSYCRTASTSSRVLRDSNAIESGNGHAWVKLADPDDVERFRTAMLICAAQTDMTWLKPRFSRNEPGKVVGQSLTTIVDPSVWTPGRLVFIGKPVVSDGLTVEPLSASIYKSVVNDVLDTANIVFPDAPTIRKITRNAGAEMDIRNDKSGLRITVNDLTLDTEIESAKQGTLTVREILERGDAGKIRCQTPYRDSNTFAAFFDKGADGKPFVHDVGTGITHWLSNKELYGFRLASAVGVVKNLLPKVKDDCGAPLEPEAIKALAVIKNADQARFCRIRSELKKANKNVPLTAIDHAIKGQVAEGNTAQTHHGYASNLIKELTVGEWEPVGHEGSLYVVRSNDGIWHQYQTEKLECLVAKAHDGKENCERRSDYSGIAQHMITLTSDDQFFRDAPVGLACPGGFYQIQNNVITIEPLAPAHRQRVKLDVTPQKQNTPAFDAFLHDTFGSTIQGDEKQQIMLVQEIAGAIMLGNMYKYQKAVVFYDPYGRAGKGTLERILRALVPPSFVTAVSPFVWDKEYYVASLAGARLNVVGELPDDQSIPAAVFKTVTGGDLITGRHPTHRPITFKNEAAHLFMSNE